MAGSTSGPTALRDLVSQGDATSLQDAVDLALTMSVAAVREQLDYDFLDEHADEASHFFQTWLPRLAAFERMEAVEYAGSQYLLSLVHIDHAYGIGARTVMEATAEVVRATAESLEHFRVFAQGPTSSPDSEVAEAVADRFDDLAARLRTVHEEILEELELLPQHSTRPRKPGA